ncbi:cathepsin d [Plakobranchus ocellatus]|uniref:Cathepsin d n=1 Tax=Plakobranchus ocellatus TaxID=259542 RepID=A0AAV4BNW6_9GAST|nr:cathepsin d [Plakobranchus ocellatus]
MSGNMEMQHQDRTECGIGDNNSSSPMVEPQSSPPQPSSASHLHNTTSRVFTRYGRELMPFLIGYRVGRGNRPSYLTLGGANPDFFTGDFTFANLTVPLKWKFRIDRIQLFNGEYTFSDGGCQAEIKPTSPMLVGPYAEVDRLNAKLGAQKSSAPTPYVMYEFDCSNVDNLPDVEFIINGETLSLSSKDYVVKRFHEGSMVCLSAFRGRKDFTEGSESLWTLGQVFMRGFYTHFDKANSRIGFAKAKH